MFLLNRMMNFLQVEKLIHLDIRKALVKKGANQYKLNQ